MAPWLCLPSAFPVGISLLVYILAVPFCPASSTMSNTMSSQLLVNTGRRRKGTRNGTGPFSLWKAHSQLGDGTVLLMASSRSTAPDLCTLKRWTHGSVFFGMLTDISSKRLQAQLSGIYMEKSNFHLLWEFTRCVMIFKLPLDKFWALCFSSTPFQIDALSKRSKEAEAAFLNVYKRLIDVPGKTMHW